MKAKLSLLFRLSVLLIAFGCRGSALHTDVEGTHSTFSDKVDAYIQSHIANGKFNGNLFIAKGDSILYDKSYGWSDRSLKIPNTDSTIFLIGSITKPFTAYAILLLEAQGSLSLDDPLSKYFPDFHFANKITIKQLLTHRSGITDYHYFEDWKVDSKRDITPLKTLAKVSEHPSIFEPGERFSYSNTGYIFLGLIIEQITGSSFESFVQTDIIEPLGLKNTGIITNKTNIAHLAKGYTSSPRDIKDADYINYNQPFSSGNMYATPQDLWKFTQAVMDSRLLTSDITYEIFHAAEHYGYGWGIRNYNGLSAYGHHGGMNGFVGSITYIPEGKYFICFLTNDDNTPKYTITEDLVSIVSGKEVRAKDRRNVIPVTEEMKKSVVGDYLVKAGDTLRVYTADNRLYVQETGQTANELFPFDTNKFGFSLLEFIAVFSNPLNGFSDTLKFEGISHLVAPRITRQDPGENTKSE